ncbi:exocyst complex component exo84, partial [Physocladia obscura]
MGTRSVFPKFSNTGDAETNLHATNRGLDLAAYSKEDFKPAIYLNTVLSKLPEDEVRSYRAILKDAKDSAASDLQRNVHKNYSEFVVISKEISTLEGDVLLLRGLLNDLAAINGGYRTGGASAVRGDENENTVTDDNFVKESIAHDATEQNILAAGGVTASGTSAELQEQQQLAMDNLYDSIEGLK